MPKTAIQPTVNVRVPKVRLRLDDVTYLRSLSSPQKIKCVFSRNRIDRLMILGLVERKDVPALAKDVADAAAELEKIAANLRKILDDENWKALGNFSPYDVRKLLDRTAPHEEIVLTAAGEKLLAEGTVSVKLQKTGCL